MLVNQKLSSRSFLFVILWVIVHINGGLIAFLAWGFRDTANSLIIIVIGSIIFVAMQWAVLRLRVPTFAWLWLLGSLLGIGLCWAILDSYDSTDRAWSSLIIIVTGSIILGAMQWVVLRPRIPKFAWLWLLGSLLGIGFFWNMLDKFGGDITFLIISVFIVISIFVFLRSVYQQNGLYLDAWIVINCVVTLLATHFVGTLDNIFLRFVVGGTIFGVFTGGLLVLLLYFPLDKRTILYIINSIILMVAILISPMFVLMAFALSGVLIPVALIFGITLIITVPLLLIRRLSIWISKRKIASPITFSKPFYKRVVVLDCLLSLNIVLYLLFVSVWPCCY